MNWMQRRRAAMMGAKKDSDILYQLPDEITTTTKDAVSTGLKLLETDIDYTVMFSAATTARDNAFFCCPTTSSPWYSQAVSSKGLYFGQGGGVSANGKFIAYGKSADIPNFSWSVAAGMFKVVITHEKDSGAATAYYNLGSGIGSGTLSLSGGTFASLQNALAFKMIGTIDNIVVYGSVKSSSEINVFLGIEEGEE